MVLMIYHNCGHKKIDEEHRELSKKINDMMRYAIKEKEKVVNKHVVEKIQDIVFFTDRHFETENSLMKLHCYPDYQLHSEIHKAKMLELFDFHRKFLIQGSEINYAKELKFLIEWFQIHIKTYDVKLIRFLNEKMKELDPNHLVDNVTNEANDLY